MNLFCWWEVQNVLVTSKLLLALSIASSSNDITARYSVCGVWGGVCVGWCVGRSVCVCVVCGEECVCGVWEGVDVLYSWWYEVKIIVPSLSAVIINN